MNNLKYRPAWMEIHLDRVKNNINEIKKLADTCQVMGIVKADAYGHGAVEVTQELIENGIEHFGVATLSEGIQLRKKFPEIKILVLGALQERFAEDVLDYDLNVTISRPEELEFLKKASEKKQKKVKVNLKVDTGMHRLGFDPTKENAKIIKRVIEGSLIEISGAYTHFANSYEDDSFTLLQYERYNFFLDCLREEGIVVPVCHVSNSAAILKQDQLNRDIIRAGIILYGVYPVSGRARDKVKLQYPMEIRSEITFIREIEQGETVGYGRSYTAPSKRKIATLPLGYADGFPRKLSNRFSFLLKGHKVPIVGFVCMDQIMVDITGIDARVGDEVTILGKSGENEITVMDYADHLETSPYEVLCMWGKRLPRLYIKEGKFLKVKDEILSE